MSYTPSLEVTSFLSCGSRLLSFLICFISQPNHCYWELHVSKNQNLQIFAIKLNKYAYFKPLAASHNEGHSAMVRAWRFADVAACRAVSKPAWCRTVREMFLPSQSWDIVKMLYPWARHFTLKCFT